MTGNILRRFGACALSLYLLLGTGLLAGCGALDVSDPTVLEEKNLANATGADLLRRAAVVNWYSAFGEATAQSGLLADEFLSDPTPTSIQSGSVGPDRVFDQRLSERLESAADAAYRRWQEERKRTSIAIEHLRANAPPEPGRTHIGQMLMVRGYIILTLAEHYCGGFPLHEIVDGRLVYGAPFTTASAYERALADFDSAVVYAADTARIADAARVGRARALLGLGRWAEAAGAAAPVPTAYFWKAEYTTASDILQRNPLVFTRTATNERRSVADREGGTGLDFVSASDPRVKTTFLGTAYDGVTGIYAIAKYPDQGAPIVLASGIEARLIEAEAALNTGGDWLGILNQLRATQITPALTPLSDPGTAEAQVDLVFRERAFWLFATGRRLGDLRRLVRLYGRSAEAVFPRGAYRVGGDYGTATSSVFAIAKEAALNPAVTGCTGS